MGSQLCSLYVTDMPIVSALRREAPVAHVRCAARDRVEAAPGRGDFWDGRAQMRAAGVEIITDYSEVSVVGSPKC